VKYVLIGLLRLYRLVISPLYGDVCRYYPSCSAYAEQSIRELGATRGVVLAVWRVLRCNPFSNGGIDHVADRPIFRKDA
jgi:hypothetical protein